MSKVIPYLEIINPSTFLKIEIVEPKECWFELSFYSEGEFEIYAPATKRNLSALKKGNLVHIPNMQYIWEIKSIEYITAGGSRMISAKGYEEKITLKNAIILYNMQLPNTVSAAFVELINKRFMPYHNGYGYQLINIDTVLSDTIATRGNLLEYLNKMTAAYGCGITAIYNGAGVDFKLYQGQDRSASIKFSQSRDNLLSFKYLSDDKNKANTIYTVANVNDVEYITLVSTAKENENKITILYESSLTNKYTATNGAEVELDLTKQEQRELFRDLLTHEAELVLAKNNTTTEISSEIDLTNSNYEFDKDYMLGDIVEVKDEFFNITATPRVIKYTLALDSMGKVTEALEFGE